MIGRVLVFIVAGVFALHAEEAPFVREQPEGALESKLLGEASGLATSPDNKDLLWLINDSGSPAEIHLAGTDGSNRGYVALDAAKNVDWEDLASFVHEGKPYLLVADTGDNAGKRAECLLYIVSEPGLPEKGKRLSGSVKAAWKIRFRYEDGPRDCEAVAVDEKAGKILLLSKRTSPPMLYELPLKPTSEELQTAKKIGQLSKPLPAGFPPIPFGTQPTSMDLAPDGSAAAVVTYFGAFLFPRKDGETWAQAFAHPPVALEAHRLRQAESIAFSRDGSVLRVVSEGGKSPVARYVKAAKAK